MPFPPSKRVIYSKNPLVEVICQVRFPAVLRIDSEVPADFQDRVRDRFPIYREEVEPLDLPKQFSDLIGARLPSSRVIRAFHSEDENWSLTLNRESMSVSTKKYETWEEFKTYLEPPLRALNEVYQPAFYSRVGLRYRDLINRVALGLGDCKWPALLKSDIAGELVSQDLIGQINSTSRQILISLTPGPGQVLLQHGLTDEDSGQCYIIDCDFSTQKTGVEHAFERLDIFNRESGRLFRWCISDRLHNAMAPQEPAARSLG